MDNLINSQVYGNKMNSIRILEGFANQHLFRLSRPLLERWGNHPLLQSLMPTDVGFFPNARYHFCERPNGSPEHILIFCVDGGGWFEVGEVGDRLLQMKRLSFAKVSHTFMVLMIDSPGLSIGRILQGLTAIFT